MDIETIHSTLERVEKSLDLRFELDSNLYISKLDTERIKENIFKNRYQNINALAEKLGNEIVTKIILKNAWLVDIRDKRHLAILNKIFSAVPSALFINIASCIVEDRVYSSLEFKRFVEGIYIKYISIKECKSEYKNINEPAENRAVCLLRYVQEDYILNNPPINVMRFIDQELSEYMDIKNYLFQRERMKLISTIGLLEEKSNVANWIIENKLEGSDMAFWQKALLSLKSEALKSVSEYIAANPEYKNKTTQIIIRKVLGKLHKCEEFKETVKELYSKHTYIRILFIQMLQPSKFDSKKVANITLNDFELCEPFPEKWADNITRIKSWDNKPDVKITTTEQLIEKLNNERPNLNQGNVLHFYANLIKKNGTDFSEELYSLFKDRGDIKTIICYAQADALNNPKSRLMNINYDDEYIEEISHWIGSKFIKTTSALNFLRLHKKYNIIDKLEMR